MSADAILEAWERYGDGNAQRLSYVLATPNVETGGRYEAIHEAGPISYFSKYELGTTTGKRLGNIQKGDGYLYRGGSWFRSPAGPTTPRLAESSGSI